MWYNQNEKYLTQNNTQAHAAQHSAPIADLDTIIRKLQPKPISQEQLVAESKGIYEDLKSSSFRNIHLPQLYVE
jgi:hypothetical protein